MVRGAPTRRRRPQRRAGFVDGHGSRSPLDKVGIGWERVALSDACRFVGGYVWDSDGFGVWLCCVWLWNGNFLLVDGLRSRIAPQARRLVGHQPVKQRLLEQSGSYSGDHCICEIAVISPEARLDPHLEEALGGGLAPDLGEDCRIACNASVEMVRGDSELLNRRLSPRHEILTVDGRDQTKLITGVEKQVQYVESTLRGGGPRRRPGAWSSLHD